MKLIQRLSEKIGEEIHDAHCYVKMAMEYKDSYPDVARVLFQLSNEEMGHMNNLHDAVTGVIAEYRKTKGDPPVDMMAIYDYLHKQQIDKAAEVKTLQSMYKES